MMRAILLLACWILCGPIARAQERPSEVPGRSPVGAMAEEFIGPFANWKELKRDYGAKGDGSADDSDAFQAALDALGLGGKDSVLYVTAGIYRLTRTMTVTSRINVWLLGENPATTTLKWDGPADGAMLALRGVAYSRVGRLTFDGSSKAGVGVEQAWTPDITYFDTGNEYADDYFQDMAVGIRGGVLGHGAAETTVLRNRFIRTKIGINVANFNALDWFVWNSRFEDCGVGVTNDPGAGNYHVFDSVFLRSKEVDLKVGNASYFAFRRNLSVGSNGFLRTNFIGPNVCPIVVQGNTIIDPQLMNDQWGAVMVQNMGPLTLLDNTVRMPDGKDGCKALGHGCSIPSDTIAFGNRSNGATVFASGRITANDNKTVPRESITYTIPDPMPPLPNHARTIIETSGRDAAAIQSAIDQAVKFSGKKPVVHIPAGEYLITSTVVIPGGLDVQVIGDGVQTRLKAADSLTGPVITLRTANKATLKDFSIAREVESSAGDGILIEGVDQPKGRVHLDQVNLGGAFNNVLVDQVKKAYVEMRSVGHSGSSGASIKVVGGPGTRTNLFSGASSHNVLSYDVTEGANLLVEDIWYETNDPEKTGFISLTGSGSFTFQSGAAATSRSDTKPSHRIDGFRGKVALLSGYLHWVEVAGDTSGLKLLVAGMQTSSQSIRSPLPQTSTIQALHNYHASDHVEATPAEPARNLRLFEELHAMVRTQRPITPTDSVLGITDVRLFRVHVGGDKLQAGIHIRP